MLVESGEPYRTALQSRFNNHTEAALALEASVSRGQAASADGFARSLLAAWKASKCSQKQLYWIHRLAMEHGEKPVEQVRKLPFFNVCALFSTALAHLRYPRLRLGGSFLVKVGRRGEVLVLSRGFVIGTVVNSELHVKSIASDEEVEALKRLETAPLEFARAYGQRTGSCMFCGHSLTTAESVGNSYGPICAEQWGLPWETTEAARRERGVRELIRLKENLDAASDRLVR
mgnify:CR=1 FL=1